MIIYNETHKVIALCGFFILVIMDYKSAYNYLETSLPIFQKTGKSALKSGLGNIIELCEWLDNPQLNYPTIHVAGTNGKGSTAHILAAILQSHGLKVGVYTSPHYQDFRERIKINGNYISKQAIIDFVANGKSKLEEIQPSFFEVTTALAFDYFKQEEVDIAIIEAGLGGEMDSTNIVKPILSIITNISLEHTNILGNTLASIARAKAGIIKPNTPVIIGEEQTEVAAIFMEKAKKEHSTLYFANQLIQLQELASSNFNSLRYKVVMNDFFEYSVLNLEYAGSYQVKNLKTALAASSVLNRMNIVKLNKETVEQSVLNFKELTNFIGRWDILNTQPLTIADSAHNQAGISLVVKQLSEANYATLHFILGIINDKKIDEILSLLPKNAKYYFCEPNSDRALSSKLLKAKANEFGLNGNEFSSIESAYEAAKEVAQLDDLIFIGGSSYLVGAFMN